MPVITDEMIESAIEQHSDPGHEDAVTVEQIRDNLNAINENTLQFWGEILDAVNRGPIHIVHEDQDAIVLADEEGAEWDEEFKMQRIEEKNHQQVIITAHTAAARGVCDHDWSHSWPIVFEKPRTWKTAETHIRATIAWLAEESGSIARATDRYFVERQGVSMSQWGRETDRPHQVISKNVKRGREAADQ